MREQGKRASARNFLVILLIFQSILCVLLFFDVPVARQVLGFCFFTIVPGFIIVKLLNLDELDVLEFVLLSVGFSVAFLLLAGLFVNEIGLLLGFSEPLTMFPLALILNGFILTLALFLYLRKGDTFFLKIRIPSMSPLAVLFLSLPVLSIVGAIWVNVFNNNVILLSLIGAIALLVTAGVLLKKKLHQRLYPLAVLMIAISLLLHSSLISNYIFTFASDVGLEYFVFETTKNNGYWNSTSPFFGRDTYQRINAMLSVTILPTIYSVLLNMDPTWVFKIVFLLIFSFVPLTLYKVWQTYVGSKYAFLATVLFMAQSTFYTEMLGLNRQMVAELFFALLLLVVLSKKIKRVSKTIGFMIFGFAMIISHYALAEIFLFFISFTLIAIVVRARTRAASRNITVIMIAFFCVVMFSWYIYTSNQAVFESFLSFGEDVFNELGDFFSPSSRGETVLRGLGLETAPSIWNWISRIFAYLTQALIIIGFIAFATRRKIGVEKEYFMLSATAVALLGALIIVPGLANTLNMSRFYHILLFFLAPLCIMGGKILVKLTSTRALKLTSQRQKELMVSTLLLFVLMPYFFFQTGFVYELTGSESWSLPLSKHRMNEYLLHGHFGYIYPPDVFSAQWLSRNVAVQNTEVYADVSSRNNILIIQGMMYGGYVNILSNVSRVPASGIVYLSWLNVEAGIIGGIRYAWNTSELSPMFDYMNKIYSNRASEIYKSPSLEASET